MRSRAVIFCRLRVFSLSPLLNPCSFTHSVCMHVCVCVCLCCCCLFVCSLALLPSYYSFTICFHVCLLSSAVESTLQLVSFVAFLVFSFHEEDHTHTRGCDHTVLAKKKKKRKRHPHRTRRTYLSHRR
jgi:hypothetical protein